MSLKSSPSALPSRRSAPSRSPSNCGGIGVPERGCRPTSQLVWVLPILTVAANGTTETQRCGCVSAPPYSYVQSWFDAVISDVIDAPAIEPVLSSTSASSSP